MIFVLCPHTDDGELGCGGTIAKQSERSVDIHYIAFSIPEPRELLIEELLQATAMIGIPRQNLHILDFRWRQFHSKRQEILDTLIGLRDEYEPDVIYCPATTDTHQDHEVICQEATRAFREQTILGYEIPRNNPYFFTQRFEILQERHVERKVKSLLTYRSQCERSHWKTENWRAVLTLRGMQIGVRWAEAFEVIKEVRE